ncbi:MAG: serine/threonine-protein kinase [Rhodothermales bacterium]
MDYWNRLEAILLAALELDDADRPGYLDQACAGDAALRQEIEDMLAAHEDAQALSIESRLLADRPEFPSPEALIGSHIGPYRIKQMLGEGGMGMVYLATRDDAHYTQDVALKLVRPGYQNAEIHARFRTERQVLARLTHPNIAALLDGGMSADGRPYLVMPYIEGTPITTYCDEQMLSIADRLRLFRTVCAAVQHAHQNLVVHRDLKPSNILVTRDGTVKLLDFGIAKLLDPEQLGVSVAVTRSELRLMTPDYAAPEQVRGSDVTTATDVYALGVLLYELLTGHSPYRIERRVRQEIERVILEEEPARPSAVVTEVRALTSSDGTTHSLQPAEISRSRRTSVARLRSALQQDLDNVVMMALRKEPERRYASAEQFSADIERYLEGRPVIAQKDTLGYRMRKFASRNRTALSLGAGALLILLALSTVTTYQALRLSRQSTALAAQRDRARDEADKARQTTDFLLNIFNKADPNVNEGTPVTAIDLLDEGTRQMRVEFVDQPDLRAELLLEMGRIYDEIGRYATGDSLIHEAIDVLRDLFGPEHRRYALGVSRLAMHHTLTGELADADSLYDIAIAIQNTLQGEDRNDLANTYMSLAVVRFEQRQFAVAESLFTVSLDIKRALFGDVHHSVMQVLNGLGGTLVAQQKTDEAEPVLREALAIADSLGLEKQLAVTATKNHLGALLIGRKEYPEAEVLFRETLAIRRELYEPGHPAIATAVNSLAVALQNQYKFDEAEPLFAESVEIQRKVPGPRLGFALRNFAMLRRDQKRWDEAEALFKEAMDVLVEQFGPDHAQVQLTQSRLEESYRMRKEDQGG